MTAVIFICCLFKYYQAVFKRNGNILFISLTLLGVFVGVPVGSGLVTFFYADGLSYLSPNPKACTNCHVMQAQYDSWQASSHHTIAKCNDCHSHGSIIEKYAQKGLNGFLHSAAFTSGLFHEPIRIRDFNLKITQKTCRSCHSSLIESSRFDHGSFDQNNCLTCHREVGHRKW